MKWLERRTISNSERANFGTPQVLSARLGELKLVEGFVIAMTLRAIPFPQDRGFDLPMEEIHQVIESRDRNEVGRGFELRLNVLKQNCVAEAADGPRTKAGISLAVTKVTFREIADVIAPQQIRANGTKRIFHLLLSLFPEMNLCVIALDHECGGASAMNDVLRFRGHES